jgi:2-dehydro-3-deoxygluconokinase
MITLAHAEPLGAAREVRLLVGGAEANLAMHAAQRGIPPPG